MKDEQRCMYLPAAWFVDKQHDIFFEAQYLLGRIPYLRKKRKKKGKKRTAHINLCASIHVISYAYISSLKPL